MERIKDWEKAQQLFRTLAVKEMGKMQDQKVLTAITNFDAHFKPILGQLDGLDVLLEKNKLDKEKITVEHRRVSVDQCSKLSADLKGKSSVMIQGLQGLIDGLKQLDATKKSTVVRGLKVMKTSVDALVKSNDTWLSGWVLNLATQQADISLSEKMGIEFMTVLRSALARALAAAQRIKATPTVTVYNKEIMTAARDITQQIGNVKKLAQKNITVPGPADPANLYELLKPFANGPLTTVKEGTPPNLILELVSQFNKNVKAVSDSYDIH